MAAVHRARPAYYEWTLDDVEVDEDTAEKLAPLHKAAYENDMKKLKKLIDKRRDVNELKVYGIRRFFTPLACAAMKGNVRAATALLDAGADPNKETFYGYTPIFFAVWEAELAMVKLLLERGTDPNKGDAELRTPLSFAVEGKFHDVAELLLDHGADANGRPTNVPDKEMEIDGTYIDLDEAEVDRKMLKLLWMSGAAIPPNVRVDSKLRKIFSKFDQNPESIRKRAVLIRVRSWHADTAPAFDITTSNPRNRVLGRTMTANVSNSLVVSRKDKGPPRAPMRQRANSRRSRRNSNASEYSYYSGSASVKSSSRSSSSSSSSDRGVRTGAYSAKTPTETAADYSSGSN